ncbi:MAG: bifunctional oligoribonuclease/PAP phosphatase NrnA [Halobacteriovoraceae bacterium]|nr:bifunctional oligoribonuclease/PAP phosphatase NrnA [Halobacteriovoraceae bacterium]
MEYQKRFVNLIKKAKNIVISTHIFPDADGIGSQIALALALRQKGKDVICVNERPLLERYEYLDSTANILGIEKFLSSEKYHNWPIDLLIVVDTNSLGRIGDQVQQLAMRSKNLLFIDHHPCPPALAALHCIDTNMSATGELVGVLIKELNVEITKDMALPLYTSILIDTSSFRYPTVTGHTHKIIGQLLDTGIRPQLAYNKIYGAKKISHMQLLGKILNSAQSTKNGEIAWIVIKEKELESFKVDPEDTHAFVNHLLILDNIKVACMFREMGDLVKVSFRSLGTTDVGIIAQALGGGGHNHSAATLIEGQIHLIVKETISKVQIILEQLKKF